MESNVLMATEFSRFGGGYSENGLLESHSDVTIIMCVHLCLNNLACLGFFYNVMQRKCITNNVVFFKTDAFVKEVGWRHYRTSAETDCVVTENFIHNRQLEMCYMPQEDSKDWSEAKSVCNLKHAKLVKIDSPAKQDHLRNTINSMAINIKTKIESGGCWLGSGFKASRIGISLQMTIEMCRGLCQGKPYIALKFGAECSCVSSIHDVSKKLPNSECTAGCKGNLSQICGEGDLMHSNMATKDVGSVYDISEQEKTSSVDFYIGLTKVTSDWKWSDNQVAVFRSFNDSTSGACAVMSSQYDFRWKSVDCTSKSGFICEI